MLHPIQINRLLTSIVASVVAMSAVATVEAPHSGHELLVIERQLRCDCNALMKDRGRQQALHRLLPKHARLLRIVSAMKHALPTQWQATATNSQSQPVTNAPTGAPAWLHPAVTSVIRVRAPSF